MHDRPRDYRDFDVSFDEDERGTVTYKYRADGFPNTEAPSISAFSRNPDGTVYHS